MPAIMPTSACCTSMPTHSYDGFGALPGIASSFGRPCGSAAGPELPKVTMKANDTLAPLPEAPAHDPIAPVLDVVAQAKTAFHDLLLHFSTTSNGLTPALYHRYL